MAFFPVFTKKAKSRFRMPQANSKLRNNIAHILNGGADMIFFDHKHIS